MRNKKGLSDVVSNVLIILIVVAAVSILGLIVINLVKSAGVGITAQAVCQTIDVKPTTCVVSGTNPNEVSTSSAIRGSGDASINITKVNFNFINALGAVTQISKTGSGAGTGLGSDSSLTIGEPVSASTVTGFKAIKVTLGVEGKDKDGKSIACSFDTAEIPCA